MAGCWKASCNTDRGSARDFSVSPCSTSSPEKTKQKTIFHIVLNLNIMNNMVFP